MKFFPKGALRAIATVAVEHAPEILTGFGVAGMFISIGLAVTETPKAIKKIEEKKEELHVEKLTPVETVKTTWKIYIPMASMAILSGACIIGGSHINGRRNAALAAAYTLSEQAFSEYKNATIETVGEKKEREIRANAAQAHIDNDPRAHGPIIITGKGKTSCYDTISGQVFEHDIEQLKQARHDLLDEMQDKGYASLNEWYTMIGIDTIPVGYDVGWRYEPNIAKKFYLEFDSVLKDGVPCLSIGYSIEPFYSYDR